MGSYVDLAAIPPGADLVAELRAVHAAQPAGRGRLWQMVVEEDDFGKAWGIGPAVWLDAGFAAETGALCWVARRQSFIRSSGLRRLERADDWLPYFDVHGLACGVHGAVEAPIELVFEAVAEVVATRQRPTCVAWAEVDEIEHTLIGG